MFDAGVMAPVKVRPEGESVEEAAPMFVETFKEVEANRLRKPSEREPISEAFTTAGRMLPVKVSPLGERVLDAAPEATRTELETKILFHALPKAPRLSVLLFAASASASK